MFRRTESDWMPDYLDLLNAQRKLGYTTEAAIADIADNPFDAGATKCYITLKYKEKNRKAKIVDNIIFADNGRGMTEYELSKALIPASTGRVRKYTNELGYFGVGLLASGLALGNRIEIFTRGSEGDFYSYIDWNEKLKSNSPANVVRPCTPDEKTSVLNAYLKESETGTVVWLSDLQLISKKYDVMMSEIEYHLSTTYYDLRDKYQLFLDNKPVKPWDFIEREDSPFVTEVKSFPVTRDAQGRAIQANVTLQISYVKQTNHKRWFEIMGRTNDNQGGALIRNGRMLTRGDMMGIEKKNPANNALRFVVTYDDVALDNHIFSLNVQKDKCQIVNKEFKDWLDGEVKLFIKTHLNELNKKFRVSTPKTGGTSGKVKSGSTLPLPLVRSRAVANCPVIVKLKAVNVNKMTPFEALQMVQELHTEALTLVEVSNQRYNQGGVKPSLIEVRIMRRISFDDLTVEDLANCRVNLRKHIYQTGRQMDYESYVNLEIAQYNLGNPSIISPKVFSEPVADLFEEAKEPVKTSQTDVRDSNIGKKVFIANGFGSINGYTLVSSSDEVDPDDGKISIYCDLGKLLIYAKENDIFEYNESTMLVMKIS